jgi:ketosteroid isomerase-like protein
VAREDVENLAGFYAAFNAGDLEPWLAFAHPQFVYRTREEFPGGGAHGLDAALDRIAALRELFAELRWEPQEFVETDERIVVVVRQSGRGRAGGVRVDERVAHVWRLDAGRARELRVYTRREEALEAVGLRESDG